VARRATKEEPQPTFVGEDSDAGAATQPRRKRYASGAVGAVAVEV